MANKVVDSLASRIIDLQRFVDVNEQASFEMIEQQRNSNTKLLASRRIINFC